MGQTQRLGCFWPCGWVKDLTQLLAENKPVAGFVHIKPSIFSEHLFKINICPKHNKAHFMLLKNECIYIFRCINNTLSI